MDIHTKCPFRNLGSRYRLKIILELQQTVGGGTYILYVCAGTNLARFWHNPALAVLVLARFWHMTAGLFGVAQDGTRHKCIACLRQKKRHGTWLVYSGFFGAAQDGIKRHDDGKVLHNTAKNGRIWHDSGTILRWQF